MCPGRHDKEIAHAQRSRCVQLAERPLQSLQTLLAEAVKIKLFVRTHGANTITVPVVDRGPDAAGWETEVSPRITSALGYNDWCTVRMQIRQSLSAPCSASGRVFSACTIARRAGKRAMAWDLQPDRSAGKHRLPKYGEGEAA